MSNPVIAEPSDLQHIKATSNVDMRLNISLMLPFDEPSVDELPGAFLNSNGRGGKIFM